MFLDCCSLLRVECLCWCIGGKILYPLLLQGLESTPSSINHLPHQLHPTGLQFPDIFFICIPYKRRDRTRAPTSLVLVVMFTF